MAKISEIIQYSKANPTSDYAKRAQQLIQNGSFDEQAIKEGVNLSWGSPSYQHTVNKQPINEQPAISMSTDTVVPHFNVNTDTFAPKDIPAGIGATMSNAVLAPAKATEQAIKMLGQIKDIFTQNGGQGIYGKYAEGVDSIMQGLNDVILKPAVGTLSTIGQIGLGQKSPSDIKQIAGDTVAGLTKFGIEQPTTAALTLQGLGNLGKPKFDVSGNPIKPTDLIHEIGGPVVEKATQVIAPAVDKIVGMANNFANHLEQQSMRLTPVAKSKLGTRLNEVSEFNIDNKVTGNPQTRLAKINKIVNQYNDTLDNYLKTEVPDNTVDVKELTDRLNNLKIKYASSDVADLEGAGRQIDDAIKRLGVSSSNKVGVGDSIPTSRLNNLKSSYYDSAYGNQVGSGLTDEVQGDIARLYKQTIEENLKGAPPINGQTIEDFNHDYGNSIISKKILTTATGRPQIGPIGRLTAKGVGVAAGSVAGVPGEIVGGLYGDKVAELFFGTHARSIVSDLLSGESEPYLPDSMTNSAMGSNNINNSIIGNTVSKVKDFVKHPRFGLSIQDVNDNSEFNVDSVTKQLGIPTSEEGITNTLKNVKNGIDYYDKLIKSGDMSIKNVYTDFGSRIYQPLHAEWAINDAVNSLAHSRLVQLADKLKAILTPLKDSLTPDKLIETIKNLK